MSGVASGRDRINRWKIKRKFIPIGQFSGLDNNGTSTISLSQGTPTIEPTSGASELTAIPMTTADEAHHFMPLPWDLHRGKKVAGRVWFAHASTDASDAPVFKLGSLFFGKQATLPEIQAGADVTTTITHDGTSATDDSIEVTPWTDLSWDQYIADTDIAVGLALELDALGSAGADECEILGIELAYMIHATNYVNSSIEALIADNTK